MSITPFLTNGVFDPDDIKAMSMALDDVCKALNLVNGNPAREVIADRIIALARKGERSPTILRDRVLKEAGLADVVGKTDGNGAAIGKAKWVGPLTTVQSEFELWTILKNESENAPTSFGKVTVVQKAKPQRIGNGRGRR